MPINLSLLKELCETPGAPGREDRIREIVARELGPLCDEVSTDAIGNVIGVRRGSRGGTLMLAAHMDEIAFMVSHVSDKGFLHFVPLGGFDPKTLAAQRVVVHGREDLPGVLGVRPIHLQEEEDRKRPPRLEDFFIDVGLPAEKVKERVRPGDVVTRERELVPVGDLLCGKSFDDRVGLFVMIEALRAARPGLMDVHVVASAQEEVGLRGAQAATWHVRPDVAIALDVTIANDVPFTEAWRTVTELGKGVAIKAFDASVIPNWKLVDFMRETCDARGVPWQVEVLPRGGTDAGAMQRSAGGAVAGCVSVPTRYVHTVTEMVHPRDVRAAIDLTAALIEECEPDAFAL